MGELDTKKKWLIGLGIVVVLYLTGVFQMIYYGVYTFIVYGIASLGVLIPVGFFGWIVWFFSTNGRRAAKRNAAQRKASLEKVMLAFGQSPDERARTINQRFDKRDGAVDVAIDYYQSGSVLQKTSAVNIKVKIGRSLASMPPKEREALRAALLLYSEGVHTSEYNAYSEIVGIIYGDGKGTIFGGYKVAGLDKSITEALTWLLKGEGLEPSIDTALRDLGNAIEKNPDNAVVRQLGARLLGNGDDMVPSGPLQSIATVAQTSNALIIGEDEHDPSKIWAFDGEGSLLTVAPPGSGKTQCHVIPNLLTWTGPAVVLDIKGEIHASTSAWRRENVGPVFKFSPLDPGNTHSYNPLLAVSDDPDHIWEDSRFLADMLIVPTGKSKDPFWEGRARDVLNAAIADTVLNKAPQDRSMGTVLDILHGVDWSRFIISLQAATQVPSMARMGRSLGDMESKMRDSVLQTALTSLSAWEGARIGRATQKSDWTPLDLRSGANPTIYICIKPNEIDSYASMLRVIIAQHIRALTSSLPERGGAPILFILDELPRLRHMPPVEEALEIGRQYGIKLWMFTQSLGQLETAYENAEGMAANCALRIFMNPSLHDGTAQKLSDDMGFRESIIDGTRQKRVEADVLAGADFTDKVIVMASGAAPARLRKHFAHSDPELSARAATQNELS